MRVSAYVVDDDALAVRRLCRLLEDSGRVELAGHTTDPAEALAFLAARDVGVLFLDVEMPGMTGFELVARLTRQPPIVFTTALDGYALRAFEVNSIDYLVKPIEADALTRALTKLERLRGPAPGGDARLAATLQMLQAQVAALAQPWPQRIASRVGDRIHVLDLAAVSCFHAEHKLTMARTGDRSFIVDETLGALEARLDPQRFVRIHRASLVNLAFVEELRGTSGDGASVRLKDGAHTELPVARDRVAALKQRLGL